MVNEGPWSSRCSRTESRRAAERAVEMEKKKMKEEGEEEEDRASVRRRTRGLSKMEMRIKAKSGATERGARKCQELQSPVRSKRIALNFGISLSLSVQSQVQLALGEAARSARPRRTTCHFNERELRPRRYSRVSRDTRSRIHVAFVANWFRYVGKNRVKRIRSHSFVIKKWSCKS